MTKLDMNKDPHNEFDEYYEASKNSSFLDADGYPTDVALKLIEMWRWDQPIEWFDFIKNIWYAADHAWRQATFDDGSIKLDISTMGWSGNEAIISAMMKNEMLWYESWLASYRGGHFSFDVWIKAE